MFAFRKWLLVVCVALPVLSSAPVYSQEGGKIDVNKVDPARLLLDNYSFMN